MEDLTSAVRLCGQTPSHTTAEADAAVSDFGLSRSSYEC